LSRVIDRGGRNVKGADDGIQVGYRSAAVKETIQRAHVPHDRARIIDALRIAVAWRDGDFRHHPVTVEEWASGAAGIQQVADHLPAIVDSAGIRPVTSRQRSQVGDRESGPWRCRRRKAQADQHHMDEGCEE